MRHVVIACAALALFAVPRAALADEAPSGAMSSTMMGKAVTPADKAFMSSMQTMMKHMTAKPTGNTDKDFVTMMMPHHQGAIDMAKIELQYGKDPEILKLAADVVKAQDSEIAEMKAWLAKHGG